ncbi:hypothetical protein ACFYRY_31845 [Streptomyces sp. NPDC005263]
MLVVGSFTPPPGCETTMAGRRSPARPSGAKNSPAMRRPLLVKLTPVLA